ncbi:MAG: methyltransferase domain-containing protein [Candidatus Obscuribacterales bacterium]|nr:methyltransferase domain-containing protein [Candidatus Obscuribacterales bacterium]
MNSKTSSHPIENERGIVVDLGTGDGRFVYQSARQNPQKFFLGIDASANLLEKISEKIHRKPAKGGVKNALFIQAAVEALPEELDGVADEVHIHFPWGSLLRGVATGNETILKNIHRICAPDAVLEVIIGVDQDRDATELQRLGINDLSEEFIATALKIKYEECGFEILEIGSFAAGDWPDICTSWAQRLRTNENRTIVYFLAKRISR